LTAIGNDLNYNRIFSEQIIKRQVFHPDTVIFFSGSGESNNILEAIQESNDGIIVPWAIIGFSGKQLDDKDCNVLHIPVNDMEVYEDCALIVCHILKRKLQEKMVEAENKIL
jgi:D-sedoheptulose 7-phosphate isomerase